MSRVFPSPDPADLLAATVLEVVGSASLPPQARWQLEVEAFSRTVSSSRTVGFPSQSILSSLRGSTRTSAFLPQMSEERN